MGGGLRKHNFAHTVVEKKSDCATPKTRKPILLPCKTTIGIPYLLGSQLHDQVATFYAASKGLVLIKFFVAIVSVVKLIGES